MIQLVGLFPHPPIVISEIGKEESIKALSTIKAMENLAEEISEINPELIIFVTPHGPIFQDVITITNVSNVSGDLRQFGLENFKFIGNIDDPTVEVCLRKAVEEELPIIELNERIIESYNLPRKLDHGIMVPWYFLNRAGWNGNIIPINIGLLPYEELFEIGAKISEVIEESGKNAVVIISGDLSHRLTLNAPAGFHLDGTIFDEQIQQLLANGDIRKIISMDVDLIENAGECGLRPLIFGLGMLDGWEYNYQSFSYEAPFGVGYLVAKFVKIQKNKEKLIREKLFFKRKKRLMKEREREGEFVKLARRSLEYYLKNDIYLKEPHESKVNKERAGVFVSIKKFGQLRGCIGTITPTTENIYKEIIKNAVSAGIDDPRFDPIEIEELDDLTITVDVLSNPEKISSILELDPKKYGVIVKKGNNQGVLLPDLPGINNAEEQVTIAKQKAGIKENERVELFRFFVNRYR